MYQVMEVYANSKKAQMGQKLKSIDIKSFCQLSYICIISLLTLAFSCCPFCAV